MQLIMTYNGFLRSCTKNNGEVYPKTDWRMKYCQKPGLLALFESEHNAPGKIIAYFYPNVPEDPVLQWLRTSAGDLQENDNIIVLKTKNSIYEFVRDEGAVSEEEKAALCCTLGYPIPEAWA